MSQSQLEIKRKILALESEFDVDKWIVNGVHVWPYLRIEIYSLLLRNYDLEPNSAISFEEIKNKNFAQRLFAKLKLILNLLFGFLNLEMFFLRLTEKKIVFFGSHVHRVKHGQEYFNRFFDSMISSHKLESDIYMVEYQKVYRSNYNSKAIIPLEKLLFDFKLINKLKSKITGKKDIYLLNDYDNFLVVLEREITNIQSLKITIPDLVKITNKIQSLVVFYKRFYLKVKPEKVIFPGYFGRDYLYAAVLAGNELKIKTIDFQHGTQSNVHMVFSSWTKIPSQGFNIMPKQYWSWDEKSKIYIDLWAQKTSNIVTKVVGQPYLQYWKQKNNNSKIENKVFLYTLNLMPLSEIFNERIVELMKLSEIIWAIRLHPRNEFSTDDIIFHLDSLGVHKSKYEIHSSRELPLPEIMSMAIIHITAFSGSLIEAKLMGIPSVIIDTIGKEIYNDYIDNVLVYYLDKNKISFESDFLDLYLKLKLKENKNEAKTENMTIINPVLI